MGRPRLNSDAEILAIARACFFEEGPAVSTMLIAERVGVSQGALFKRFGTKEQLLLAALEPPNMDGLMTLLRAGPDDTDLQPQLRVIAEEVATSLEILAPGLSVLRCGGYSTERVFEEKGERGPPQVRRELAGWLRRAQEQGRICDGDPETMGMILLGALHIRPYIGYLQHGSAALPEQRHQRLPERDEYLDLVVQIFCEGSTPRHEPDKRRS